MKLDPTVTHPLTLKGYKTFIDKHLKSNFDYSKAVYVNAKTPILIICNSCNKEFRSTPDSHKKAGCIHCSRKALGNSQKSNTAEFIKKAKSVHGNKYDYSLTKYNSNNTKVKIICPIHGEFEQLPINPFNKGQGCPKCGAIKRGMTKRFDFTNFVERVRKVHSNMYYYHEILYDEVRSRVVANCPIHGEFKQVASLHLKGCGCPKCNIGTFNPLAKNYFVLLKD